MVNTEQSRSRLEDADIAKVSSEYAQADVLRQAAVSILSQSNIRNQDAINLLQR
jgi:flagellin